MQKVVSSIFTFFSLVGSHDLTHRHGTSRASTRGELVQEFYVSDTLRLSSGVDTLTTNESSLVATNKRQLLTVQNPEEQTIDTPIVWSSRPVDQNSDNFSKYIQSGKLKNIAVYFEGEDLPPTLRDFPCSHGGLGSSHREKTCKIKCSREEEDRCGIAACRRFAECSAVVMRGVRRGRHPFPRNAFALLKTGTVTSTSDDSMDRFQMSKWRGRTELTTNPRPRMYIVASFGGSGSKMLTAFLHSLPPKYKSYVWHVHDRYPPPTLRALVAAKGEEFAVPKVAEPRYVNVKPRKPSVEDVLREKARKRKMKGDARKIRFEGDARFRNDTKILPRIAIGDYRVIFIYKDPSEALVSRYGEEHCANIQGDCHMPGEKCEEDLLLNHTAFPNLREYARCGVDFMGLNDHFNAYVHPLEPRNYPVVCLNYHKLWDNLPAVLKLLGLPVSLAPKFPKRVEKDRSQSGDRHGGGGELVASEDTKAKLRRMYSELVSEISSTPAVLVV